MSSIPVDVVILPSDELAEKAIDVSQKLEQFNGAFTLEDGKFYAHSSLYMLELDESKIGEAKALLTDIASRHKALSLNALTYCQKLGYIDIEYEVASALADLQDEVVRTFNLIRSGMRKKDIARMQEATGLALENFQNYGYKYVGALFRPHITFTRFEETKPEAETLLPTLQSFNGSFPKIGLFEMGDNGTCVRKIAEFELIA